MKKGSKLVLIKETTSLSEYECAAEYVVSGAIVSCSKGTKETHIIFSDRGYNTGYGEVGLDIDTSGFNNFADSFGYCSCTDRQCCMAPVEHWIEVETGQKINGGHPLLVQSMLVCKNGGIVSFKNNGQTLQKRPQNFSLPEKYRHEIEVIISSREKWEVKVDLIGQVYERYLYAIYRRDIDKFYRVYRQHERTSQEFIQAEKSLGIVLQSSNIDIKEVARAMGEDMLRIVPQSAYLKNQLVTFATLVGPDAPADLKARPLSKAIEKEGYDFSIWSRRWEKNMRSDYLGNYLYGYNGAAYFNNFNFDDIIPSLPFHAIPFGPTIEANPGRVMIEQLRKSNPNKTDAEMLLLLSAGGAQVLDDGEIRKYLQSLIEGNWGDNEVDSEFVSEGINDFYNTKGIDKSERIETERK